MAAERNHFNINLGDTIYSDSEVGGAQSPVPCARSGRSTGRTSHPWRRCGHCGSGRHGTATGTTTSSSTTSAARSMGTRSTSRKGKAFTDYSRRCAPAPTASTRTFRWGKHVELFFLDQRSFRRGRHPPGACATSPARRISAPTAPAAVRQAFTVLIPTLAQPDPQACLEKDQRPSRTMLGAASAYASCATCGDRPRPSRYVNETPIMQLFRAPLRPLGGLRA